MYSLLLQLHTWHLSYKIFLSSYDGRAQIQGCRLTTQILCYWTMSPSLCAQCLIFNSCLGSAMNLPYCYIQICLTKDANNTGFINECLIKRKNLSTEISVERCQEILAVKFYAVLRNNFCSPIVLKDEIMEHEEVSAASTLITKQEFMRENNLGRY